MFRLILPASCLTFIVIGTGSTSQARAEELDLPAIAELHVKEAAAYAMFLDPARKKPLDFQAEPVFKWQNLTNQGGQLGAIYVWTRAGRPEIIGTMFSLHEEGKRKVVHEFHTLAESIVTVDSPPGLQRKWIPKGTLFTKPIDHAPDVAETAARRMTQMRALSREFAAYTQMGSDRVELRLAPQPLIRYQPTLDDVLDGALFAFLSSAAGTDPEVMLQIEARKSDPSATNWSWRIGVVRFTERDLVVSREDKEVYSSIANPKLHVTIEDRYLWCHNPDDTYFVFQAKFVPELTKAVSK